MKITKLEDIESWKEARTLTSSIYILTRRAGFFKDYGLKD